MHFSSNVASLTPSATLAITARARAVRATGRSVVDLSAGEPSFPTPRAAAVGAAEAVRAGPTGYPPTPGFPELRESIASYVRETTSAAEVSPEEVLVSAGVKQALFNLVFCLAGEGDEVLVPSPYWTSYIAIVELARARPVVVPVGSAGTAAPAVEALERHRTGRTRALLLNSPANPSGRSCSLAHLEEICAWAGRHGIWVLSDEIYRRLYYAGPSAPSVLDVEDRPERVVMLDGVSKAFSMPGWRIGWAVAPPDLLDKAAALQSQTTSAAAGPSQYAAHAILRAPEREEVVTGFRDTLDRRRRAAVRALAGIPGLAVPEPSGALYAWGRLAPAGPFGEDSLSAADALLREQGVAVVPGEAFGAPGHLRMNFAVEEAVFAEGADRIRAFFAGRA
ncbi:MAG: aminotransferase class I/II-fold pyridoxal phosphate-dependent enzyme [Gemmatimonadota bacterium]|nr:aminotransferase class I/II-fold pyridoxal phosphate-dependent enzyme [Gemmatimonadota bacterium]